MATLQLSPQCSPMYLHDDGVGDHWSDCTAPATWTSEQATVACTANLGGVAIGNGVHCVPTSCGGDDGGAPSAVCTLANGSAANACTCWNYTGPGAGHVKHSLSGCVCASNSDPSWN